MSSTVVTPPASADIDPDSQSSPSIPGCLKWTCGSIIPGITTIPSASTTDSARGSVAVKEAILSPTTRRFPLRPVGEQQGAVLYKQRQVPQPFSFSSSPLVSYPQ
jgi:hypothetical protein